MREIKFRVWESLNKKMYYLDFALYEFNKGLNSHKFVLPPERQHLQNPYTIMNLDAVKIMQFTGLKDKNGKEIYESDILRVWQEDEHTPNRDIGGGIIDFDHIEGFSQIGKVSFEGCSFDYSTVKTLHGRHEKIHAPIDWINNYEVAGNIYENQDLLES